VTYRSRAVIVLERWRELDRAMGSETDATRLEILRGEAQALRDEYQALVLAARERERPEPPPWPPDAEGLA
jgi:hypothetical protein